MNRRTAGTYLLGTVIVASLAMTGCTAGQPEGSSPSGASGTSATPGSDSTSDGTSGTGASASPSAKAQPEQTWADPTCDNTMTSEALARYQAAGWTGEPQDRVWLIGGVAAEGGILCQWMEDHSVATDNFTWIGWAPAVDAEAMVNDLVLEGGWRREDAPEGIYMTADDAQMMPIVDAEGYGTTYLFTGGQVRYASTKAELVSITAPPGFPS